MTQYDTLIFQLCNQQLNKLKSRIKNGTEVTSNLSSNVIGSSDDETNFLYILFSINTKASRLLKGFANGLSANIKVLKTQLFKMMQLGGIIRECFTIIGITASTRRKFVNNVRVQATGYFIFELEKFANTC